MLSINPCTAESPPYQLTLPSCRSALLHPSSDMARAPHRSSSQINRIQEEVAMSPSTNRRGTRAHARMLPRICLLLLLLLGLALPNHPVYAGPPVPGTTGGRSKPPHTPNTATALANPLQQFQSFDLRG